MCWGGPDVWCGIEIRVIGEAGNKGGEHILQSILVNFTIISAMTDCCNASEFWSVSKVSACCYTMEHSVSS